MRPEGEHRDVTECAVDRYKMVSCCTELDACLLAEALKPTT